MGYKNHLISQSNQYLEGLLGVCLPKENDEMHYLIGVTNEEMQSDWEQVELVEGRYLVFDAKGPVPESIKQAMQTIHRKILHTLDYELRSAPFLSCINQVNYIQTTILLKFGFQSNSRIEV